VINATEDRNTPRTIAEVVARLESGRVSASPVPSGFEPLDTVLEGGFRTRELVIVGGLPGIGKTAIALQWARHAASRERPVVYACYEHDEATLLGRLLTLEIGELSAGNSALSSLARSSVRAVTRGESRLEDELPGNVLLRAAYERLGDYAEQLQLVRASGVATGLEELDRMAARRGPGTVLFVDYLQKIPIDRNGSAEADAVTRLAEGLKDLSLERDIAIVAIVAGDESGLHARRLRLHHLRGAAGLAYEADIVLMLNEKALAVSKSHSAFDPLRAETFKNQVVLSIDKNRGGPAPVDMEFEKDLSHYRMEPSGGFVEDRLVDNLMHPE
jgi:replicative DNA helicase